MKSTRRKPAHMTINHGHSGFARQACGNRANRSATWLPHRGLRRRLIVAGIMVASLTSSVSRAQLPDVMTNAAVPPNRQSPGQPRGTQQ